METKKKHNFLDFSKVDPALEKRNCFKCRVEFEQIESYFYELKILGEWKHRTSSCGIVFTKLTIDDFKKELIKILHCEENDVKISNLSINMSTGYAVSKFM